jgi:branched-subunit amino acid aminotransferase/4-amino-4-deoxychorismate lyase
MRSINGRIAYLDAHLDRLIKSCGLLKLGIPVRPDRIKAEIAQRLILSASADNYVRLTVERGGSGTSYSVLVRPYHPYPAEKYQLGFRAAIAPGRQKAGYQPAQIKTTLRGFYESGYEAAKKKGFDEALILNDYGYVAEGTRSNVFMAKDGELFTPELDSPCLDGITRKAVFILARLGGIDVFEAKFTLADLYVADEALLTNSLIGVMPLVAVENRGIASGKPGKLTRWFIKRYNSLLK